MVVAEAEQALEGRLSMIQALIPLWLEAVAQGFQAGITRLAGPRCAKDDERAAWPGVELTR